MSAADKQFHEVAAIFDLMEGQAFRNLVNDIRDHGLREPIWLHRDGRIVDGRNRYRACLEAGVEPQFRQFEGNDVQLVTFVVSLNLHRRHLDESQRAMVAGRLASLRLGSNQHQPRGEVGASIDAPTQSAAADLLNVSRPSVQRARVVLEHGDASLIAAVDRGEVAVSVAADLAARVPKEQQRAIVEQGPKVVAAKAKTVVAQERQQQRVEKIVEIAKQNAPLDLPTRYPVIYADPPWRYEHAATTNREIENHYPTMALEEICALPVREIAAQDAVLFMWTTSPKLAESFRVLDAWGFTYRTSMVWVKDVIGMGYYARQRHELLLIATRGTEMPAPAPSDRPDSVVEAPRGRHSEKPDLFYGLIDRMYPNAPKVELFARTRRQGWAAWGNQAVPA